MIAALVNLAAFLGLTVALGAVVTRFAVLSRSGLAVTERAPAARHAASGAAWGSALLLLSAVVRALWSARELSGPDMPWFPMLRVLITETALGKAIAMQAIWAAAATLAFASARADRERGWRAAAVSVVILAMTPGLLGHHAAVEQRAWALGTATIHVLAVGAWIGGLFHLWRASLVASEATLLRMLGAFHAVALAAVACLALSGVAHTLSFIDGLGQLTATPWGRLLLLKLGFVGATLALGFRHWRGAEARIRAGERQAVSASLFREVLLAAAVLATTGILTVTAPPE